MKKLLRITAISAVVVATLLAAGAAFIYFDQQNLISAVLQNIKQQTGVEIVPASSTIELRNHLSVVLHRPRVFSEGREIVALDGIRAIVSYNAIVFNRGLPLHQLILQGAALKVPFTASAKVTVPRPDRELIQDSLARLRDLATISKRLDIIDLALSDDAGAPMLAHAQLTAHHGRATPRLWSIDFETDCVLPQFKGMHAAGSLLAGSGGTLAKNLVLKGKLWFWKLPLEKISIGNIEASGKSHGQLLLTVTDDGGIDGNAEIGLKNLVLASPDLSSPLELGDYTFEARFTTSSSQVTISDAKLSQGGKPIAAAQAYIAQPYTKNPGFAVDLAALKITWRQLADRLRVLKKVPLEIETLMRHVTAGQLQIQKASVESSFDAMDKLTPEAILKKLSFSATLSEVSFAPPTETRLPDVTGASVQIVYAKQILSVTQGSAKLGNSSLSDANAQLDLSRSLEEVPYKLSVKADLDVSELKPSAVRLLETLKVHESDRLETLTGTAQVDLDASGSLKKQTPTRPEQYVVKIEPHNLTVGFRGTPGPIKIASGALTVAPRSVRLEKISARTTGGTADFDGELKFGPDGVGTRGITVDVHQMPAQPWLGVVVDPDDFAASGNLGGKILLTSDSARGVLVNGKLTLGEGKVQFGFLRAPLMVHPAVLTLHDRGLVLTMSDARLEQSPIDFKVSVPDIRNPRARLDVSAQKLDLEVMKFVRLPWTPTPPPAPPKIPIAGHIVARDANLVSFAMKNAKTDFTYDSGNWRVYNFTAQTFEGNMNLVLVGRQKDNWMEMLAQFENVNASSLFLMSPKFQRAPLSGHLDMSADLWADTDADFFSTLAGNTFIKLRDGNLDKFPLVSRLLGLVDLRSWITAKMPDPRVSGIQFRTVTANFAGHSGLFYTDDLKLDGPVMNIGATGNVDVDQSTLDMKIAMIPFSTVNWLLSSIPLVGENVAGGAGTIIAAYFNVRGPIADPSVTPAPITSVAELVKKTLGMPVNIIRPDTIK